MGGGAPVRVRDKAHTNTFQDNAAETPVRGPNVYCMSCEECPPTKNYVSAPIQCPGAGSELFTTVPIFFVITIALATLYGIVQTTGLGGGNVTPA